MLLSLLFLVSWTLADAQVYLRGDLIREEVNLRSQYNQVRKTTLDPAIVAIKLKQRSGNKVQILDWYRKETDFQKSYDIFQNKKLKYFADFVQKDAQCLKDRISKKSMSVTDRNQIAKQWSELLSAQRAYEEKRNLFGTEKDYLRVLAYNDLFRAQEAMKAAFEDALDINNFQFDDNLGQIYQDFQTLPQLVKVLYAMRFQRQSGQGETPIIDALGEGVLAMARANNVKMKWNGLHHLPRPVYDGKTLNVVAFEHANSYLDTMVQAAIPKERREGLGFFGAAKYVFPEAWVNSLDKSDHYIVVNEGKEIPRTLEIIQARKLHGFLAAAEGLTPAGLFETRPVSPLFTQTYWELKENGLHINLYPMSFPDNFRLYNAWKTKGTTVSTGVVGESLSSAAADDLTTLTKDKKAIGIWLRSMWHKTLKTDDNVFLSSPALEQLERDIRNRLWGNLPKTIRSECF